MKLNLEKSNLNEYIENKEQVEKILNTCNYNIKFVGEDFRNYYYKLYINKFAFNYFEGKGNDELNDDNKNDKIINAVWCLLIDRQSINYCNNEYDFICEFGYNENAETMKNGHKIYNDILENNKKLAKFFDDEQLDFLTENIQL